MNEMNSHTVLSFEVEIYNHTVLNFVVEINNHTVLSYMVERNSHREVLSNIHSPTMNSVFDVVAFSEMKSPVLYSRFEHGIPSSVDVRMLYISTISLYAPYHYAEQ